MTTLDELALKIDALENVDNGKLFQRKARVLQALWRIEMGYPVGVTRGVIRGATLAMPWAEETLSNYLNDTIRDVIRQEVHGPGNDDKLYGKPRIYNHLLSSQPLAFNLFAVLSRNIPLATKVFRELTAGRCQQITRMEFEYSPGRRDPRYLGDRSAFDVYAEYEGAVGHGFIGIEVKYHEDLDNKESDHRSHYDHVADNAGCFDPGSRARLKMKPLQQVWRDHLLAESILHADKDKFTDGFFVFLSPKDNDACNAAVAAYHSCLISRKTFEHWTLESVAATIRRFTDDPWIASFQDRYLNFAKLDALL